MQRVDSTPVTTNCESESTVDSVAFIISCSPQLCEEATMPREPRRDLVDETRVGLYHCIQRTVRRAWLCGLDPLTGNNYDHRKVWIRDRLEFLAAQFSIDICTYAVMSNHLHVVLRNRPDVVETWSDEQVARRWWNLFPKRKDKNGNPLEPEEHELKMLMADRKKLKERRKRLSSISWFMRCLAEPIARKANKEDGCKGRFWEGRYKCQRLLDESAVLACSIYVDLNPIRAGIAKTPEASEFTSAYERIQAGQQSGLDSRTRDSKSTKRAAGLPPTADAGWLSPVEVRERGSPGPDVDSGGRRASRKGFLPVKLAEYLKLLDWTGRQVRRDKRGAIPSDLRPILDRIQLSEQTWVETVTSFGRWFHRAAGRAESLAAEATTHSRRWLQGISHSRAVFHSSLHRSA
jgi:REP element-mobilizing transposase RayT